MYRKHLILACLLMGFALPKMSAQEKISEENKAKLIQLEDSLARYADSLGKAFIPMERLDFCITFTGFLKEALNIPGSAYYPFSKLTGKVHILYPEDKSFRIFNWLVAPSPNVRRYYGVIQLIQQDPQYYPLIDYSEELVKEAETTIQSANQWVAGELYRILTRTDDQGIKRYFLFGFNTHGLYSNKKILDVLSFSPKGPILGAPIFIVPDDRGKKLVEQTRLILEYKKSAQASLNYDEDKKMIVFNRLGSEINDYRRKSTYIPTGQTDGLRWDGQKWVFVKEAIPVLRLHDGQAPIDGVMGGN